MRFLSIFCPFFCTSLTCVHFLSGTLSAVPSTQPYVQVEVSSVPGPSVQAPAIEILRLSDLLARAEVGEYVVLEQNKIYTLLSILGKEGDTLLLEEVSIPAASFNSHPLPWKQWLEEGAHGHTSWMISWIDLRSGICEKAYSFTLKSWIDVASSDTFLNTLLNLPFYEQPDPMRRRIGMPPGYGKPDYRPIWSPPLIVNSTRLPSASFRVWKARWPSDGSDLSRKTIEIYLPEPNNDLSDPSLKYPLFFPYWVEVEGKIGCARMRVIDSGTGLISPSHNTPLFSRYTSG